MKNLCLILCLFFLFQSIQALELYDLIKKNYTSRALSMGKAFSAVAEADGAIFSNPAGLSKPGASYSFQYLDYDNLYFKKNYANFVYYYPFGYANLQLEDMSGDNFSMHLLGYGRQESSGVSWGINIKNYRLKTNNQKSSGWSSDFGFLVRVYPHLTASVVAQDFYQKNTNLPMTAIFGLSGRKFQDTLLWSTEVFSDKKQSSTRFLTRIGAELNMSTNLAMRLGLEESNISGGIGFDLPIGAVDLTVINNKNKNVKSRYAIAYKVGVGSIENQYYKRFSLKKPAAYAEFRLGGNIAGGQSGNSILGGEQLGSNDILSLINDAKKDKTCEGFIIRIGSLGSSLSAVSVIQEIRNELVKAKMNGKKIFVYIESSASLLEYYVASIADMIFMPEMGAVGQIGIQYEITKAGQLLNNFGLKQVTISSGKYKASSDIFSDEITAAERVMMEKIIDQLFSQVIQEIEESRNLDHEVIEYMSDGRLVSAHEALELGLVDDLLYWPDVKNKIKKYIKGVKVEKNELNAVPLSAFRPFQNGSLLNLFNQIAIIEIDGAITQGKSGTGFLFGGRSSGAETLEEMIEKVSLSPKIKGVIIRVNSPGGSILAADRVFKAIEKLKKTKLVYASMGNLAASGGYYVSLNSNKIYANPSSLTGSVGVISSRLTYEELSSELGVKREVIKTGEFMGIYSSTKKMSKKDFEFLQSHQNWYYRKFVDLVKNNRNLSQKEVYDISQGQIIVGEQALELKMIDEVGGLYDAVEDMADVLNIDSPRLVFVRQKNNGVSLSSGISAKLFNFSLRSLLKNSYLLSELKNLSSNEPKFETHIW